VDLQLEAALTPGDDDSINAIDPVSNVDPEITKESGLSDAERDVACARDRETEYSLGTDEQETEETSEAGHGVTTPSSPQVLEAVLDHQLPTGISDLIDADVARTFPSHKEFRRRGGPARLRGVLRSLASMDSELGYCQSLNFLAAIFILVFMDDRVVLSAVGKTLVKLGIRRWYTDGMQQLRADTLVLEELIRERLPAIHEALTFHRFDLLFVSSKWFLCLFTTVLDGEAIKRVWDIMLCDGIEAVFRVALTLLARKEPLILSAKSCDDLIFMFQEGQTDACPDTIVRAAYDPDFVGSLSRADLSRRRQQAVSQISKDDTRSEMRQQHLLRGGVRPASILAR
jgi:hypothetical protein